MRRQRNPIFIIWIWLACLTCACSKGNEPQLPVYLAINNSSVVLDETTNFRSELGIRDIWLDHGASSLAAFRMPAVVPLILQEGIDSVLIRGGIFESGLSSSRIPYPFWKPVNYSVSVLNPLDTLQIEPTFTYYSRDSILSIPFEEGFENASMVLEPLRIGPNSVDLNRSNLEAFEGVNSGRIRFTESEYDFEYVATDYIPLPQSGNNDIYIEITYKNDIPFTLGLYFILGQIVDAVETGIFFNSDLEWNTVYIHINDQVRAVPSGARFKLFFRANSLNQDSGRGRPGNIYLDNLRIVHFK